MAYQYILFERSEGVGIVTLNRPEQLNAFTPQMLQELTDVFRGMERDPQVRAILITGAGKAFCGGEDLRQRAELELNQPVAPGSTPAPSQANSPVTPITPTFEAFQPNFSLEPTGQASPLPYNPNPLSSSTGPQPQLAAEFAPLTSNPQPVENPRSQPVPLTAPASNAAPVPPLASNTSNQLALSIAEQVRRSYNPLIRQIRQIEKPVIAAVNGVAAGYGLGLALACDIRYASERARFVEVSVRVGLLPGSGTAYFLPRLIGLSKAMELAFQGEELNASEAERLGLVSRTLPVDQLMEESRKLALRLAKGPTRTIGLTKSLIYRSANASLEQGLELEAQLTDQTTSTQDYKEGLRAFLEKRPPNFQGQ